jgi:DNA repair ATPase RecN
LVSRPWWSELTDAQRVALSPLAAEWNNMELFRKKKWLEIGNRFATMKPEEQQRMQERMREWAKLTPDQRRVAREIYSRTNKLDPDQKSAQWMDYQQLPEEEKKKLAADTAAKKRVANLPSINTKSLDKIAADKHPAGTLATPPSAATPAPLAVPAAPASPSPAPVK